MEYPYSLEGRNILGRNTPGYDKRIRSQPIYDRESQVPMDHTMAPPGTGLGCGVQYGAGVQRLNGFDWGSFVLGGLLAFIFSVFVLTASGRRVAVVGAKRLERYIA